jgi:hypothetical protein
VVRRGPPRRPSAPRGRPALAGSTGPTPCATSTSSTRRSAWARATACGFLSVPMPRRHGGDACAGCGDAVVRLARSNSALGMRGRATAGPAVVAAASSTRPRGRRGRGHPRLCGAIGIIVVFGGIAVGLMRGRGGTKELRLLRAARPAVPPSRLMRLGTIERPAPDLEPARRRSSPPEPVARASRCTPRPVQQRPRQGTAGPAVGRQARPRGRRSRTPWRLTWVWRDDRARRLPAHQGRCRGHDRRSHRRGWLRDC